MNNEIYYRPEWTSGKYNVNKHVAIMFNNLTNCEYFFENDSADIIGYILSVGRNNKVSIEEVSYKYNITTDIVTNFFESLQFYGLLSNEFPTIEVINEYRKQCKYNPVSGNIINNSKGRINTTARLAYIDAVKEESLLFSAVLELTYLCSEKCIHCYNPGATRNDSEISLRGDWQKLTFNDYKRIIDELCDAGLVMVELTGGDPFSNKYAWDIIEYLYKRDITIRVLTNGQNLVGYEERLASFYPIEVQFSIYSSIPDVHDKITRTKGSWNKTISVMRKLHDLAVPLDIACPLLQTNLKSYRGIKSIAEGLNATFGVDIRITDAIDGDKCPTRYLRLTPEQLEVVLLDENVLMTLSQSELERIEQKKGSVVEGAPCNAAINSFCINPNGDLTPCCAFHFVFGNIKENSFRNIVSRNKYIEWWKSINSSQYEECYTHDYCDYCELCPGHNFNANKSVLKAGENNCYIAKVRHSLAIKIKNNIDVLEGKSLEEKIGELKTNDFDLKKEYE